LGLKYEENLGELCSWRKWLYILKRAAEVSGATVIPKKSIVHVFPGGGFSALVMLAESHISIHTWPEQDRAIIDIFTCGNHTDPQKGAKYLVEKTKPRYIISQKKIHRN